MDEVEALPTQVVKDSTPILSHKERVRLERDAIQEERRKRAFLQSKVTMEQMSAGIGTMARKFHERLSPLEERVAKLEAAKPETRRSLWRWLRG